MVIIVIVIIIIVIIIIIINNDISREKCIDRRTDEKVILTLEMVHPGSMTISGWGQYSNNRNGSAW